MIEDCYGCLFVCSPVVLHRPQKKGRDLKARDGTRFRYSKVGMSFSMWVNCYATMILFNQIFSHELAKTQIKEPIDSVYPHSNCGDGVSLFDPTLQLARQPL